MKQFFLKLLRFFANIFLFIPRLFIKNKKVDIQKDGIHSFQEKETFGSRLKKIFSSNTFDSHFYTQLEDTLIAGDVGVDTTIYLIKNLKEKLELDEYQNISPRESADIFRDQLHEIIAENPLQINPSKLNVLFVMGVNGVGKTTSIAKLANYFKEQGYSIVIAACDTFRAAAIDQLCEWGSRIDVPVIKQQQNADPGAVLFDALDSAIAKKVNILIVDTAGRLHNRKNLMNEVEKLHRIIKRKAPDKIIAENILVLDAQTGQNAYRQAEAFHSLVGINGVILSKMDSTAKGGVVLALSHKLRLPVKFIGVGEKLTDIKSFDNKAFIDSLLNHHNPAQVG